MFLFPRHDRTSEDERFLVKTMRKSEMKVLLDMLPAYAEHMEKHPHSLITRFFGLHKLRPLHGRSVRHSLLLR
jgi:1-phosphatidylinositol-4-phosphate 5-kinase